MTYINYISVDALSRHKWEILYLLNHNIRIDNIIIKLMKLSNTSDFKENKHIINIISDPISIYLTRHYFDTHGDDVNKFINSKMDIKNVLLGHDLYKNKNMLNNIINNLIYDENMLFMLYPDYIKYDLHNMTKLIYKIHNEYPKDLPKYDMICKINYDSIYKKFEERKHLMQYHSNQIVGTEHDNAWIYIYLEKYYKNNEECGIDKIFDGALKFYDNIYNKLPKNISFDYYNYYDKKDLFEGCENWKHHIHKTYSNRPIYTNQLYPNKRKNHVYI